MKKVQHRITWHCRDGSMFTAIVVILGWYLSNVFNRVEMQLVREAVPSSQSFWHYLMMVAASLTSLQLLLGAIVASIAMRAQLWKIWCTIRTRIPSWYICYFCGLMVGIVSTGLSDPIVSGSSP
jgi:hypothetical protein